MKYAIEAEGLVKRFGKTTALAGVDLAARAGTVLGVLGPNGAGKTTAVRVLATLIKADAGTARVGGYDVVHQAHEVRQLVGLTGQYAAVDEELTGEQNLIMVGRLLDMSRRDARSRAAELLERFELADAGRRRARTYSGGMRRRLDLAVSLVGRPAMLYLDEPTTGLDPVSRNEMWAIVRELVSDGSTVLLTTQYMDEADQLADDIAVIDHGLVIATGTPDELKTKTGGQTLDIRPTDESQVAQVAAIVEELTGTPATVDGTRLSAPVSDPAIPAAVLRRLDDAQITVTELALRLPSLDDVFLSLTGHKAEEEPAGQPDLVGTRRMR
jgi:oleandomycin transport system ATP-binding protein